MNKIAVALHAWSGDGGGKRCLTFTTGDRIKVIEARETGGWWAGSLDGRQGWFPSSFCRIEHEPEEDLLGLGTDAAAPNLIGEPGALVGGSSTVSAGYDHRLSTTDQQRVTSPASSHAMTKTPLNATHDRRESHAPTLDGGFATSVSDFVGGAHVGVSGNTALDRRLQSCKLGHMLTPAAADGGTPHAPSAADVTKAGSRSSVSAPTKSTTGRPIWQSLAFIDLFADYAGGAKAALGAAESDGRARTTPRGLHALGFSLRFLVRALKVLSNEVTAAASVDRDFSGVANPLPELDSVAGGLRLGLELLSLQQPSLEHPGLLSYLEQLVPMITQLPIGGELLVPSAWDRDGAAFLLVLHR